MQLEDVLQLLREHELPVFDETVEYLYLLEQWKQSGGVKRGKLFRTLSRRKFFPRYEISQQLLETYGMGADDNSLYRALRIEDGRFRTSITGSYYRDVAFRHTPPPCIWLSMSPEADMW